MLLRRIHTVAALLRLSTAYTIPSDDGFPKPDDQQLFKLELEAGGVISNAAPPPKLSAAGIANFQLVAFNEQFEVAFFSSLIENITNNVEGYQTAPGMKDTSALLDILRNVKAVSRGLERLFNRLVSNLC